MREEGQTSLTRTLNLSLLVTGCRGRVWGFWCVRSAALRSHWLFRERAAVELRRAGKWGLCPKPRERWAESRGLFMGASG